ncbi:MAG TPA: hypothetical protein VFR28_10230 [Allosphingosinicella sp.]|nr:hypothetical protein [Allosphingosinicella sp.]
MRVARLALAAALLALSACERDPMARTDDLWPGLSRAPATAFPTAEDIESACFQANIHFKDEVEKTPGNHVDLEYADYPVRRARCSWEAGSASTALCTFDQTMLSWGQSEEERRRAFVRLRDHDWEPHEARLVKVAGPRTPRWIAPRGCRRVPGRTARV